MSGLVPFPGLVDGTRGIVLYTNLVSLNGIVDRGTSATYMPPNSTLKTTGQQPVVTKTP